MAKIKEKSLVQRAADAIDHAIHPASEQKVDEILSAAHVERKYKSQDDLAKHPKFDKFKNPKGSN